MASQGKHASSQAMGQHGKGGKKKAALTVVAVLCGIVILVAGAVAIALSIGESNLTEEYKIESPAGVETADGGKAITFDGKKYRQKDGMSSILILGHDNRQTEELNGQTDFVMILALNTETGKIDLISIPRDTMAKVNRTYNKSDVYYDTETLQLAAAFAYGSDFEHSAEHVCDVVSTLVFNIPMNYYYVLNVNGVGALADAVGGVELVSLEDVAKTDMKKDVTYNLTGELARQYVVERDTAVEHSAMDRLQRQKQFIGEYLKKLMSVSTTNPGVVLDTVNALATYSTTNIGIPEFTYLAKVLIEHGIGDLDLHTLSGEIVYNEDTNYEEYWLDENDVYKTVLDIYYDEV